MNIVCSFWILKHLFNDGMYIRQNSEIKIAKYKTMKSNNMNKQII